MTLGEPDESGRRRPFPVEGSNFQVDADTILLAIGEVPDLSFLPQEVPIQDGLIQTDEMGFVHANGIFAGGDVSNPTHTVAEAIGSGKKAALAIHEYLRGRWLKEKFPMIRGGSEGDDFVKKYFHPPKERPIHRSFLSKRSIQITSNIYRGYRIPAFRSKREEEHFKRSISVWTDEMAQEEAGRCFNCGVCNGCDNCWVYCPDVAVKREKDHYEIDYDYCKGCGICFEECPRGAILLEEEGR